MPAPELAVRALLVAATELPLDGCTELSRLLTEHIVTVLARDNSPSAKRHAKDMRFICALRAVAETLGHPPSTPEFIAEYRRRKQAGEDFPSIASILRHFKDWPAALTAAGLTGEDPLPTHHYRRRRAGSRGYDDQRLIDCLQACAREARCVRTTERFVDWRDEALAGRPGRRPWPSDIPSLKTYYLHFGSWPNSLRAAGLDPSRQARATATSYAGASARPRSSRMQHGHRPATVV